MKPGYYWARLLGPKEYRGSIPEQPWTPVEVVAFGPNDISVEHFGNECDYPLDHYEIGPELIPPRNNPSE